ncbi:lipopolysaccharide core heptose(II) kinase RfaY [Erwinia sp. CPCC 100877]|nr:lipopolysaccharide core heptose(II) kinase RfaY [Erwinia sp. CPCC 100877]
MISEYKFKGLSVYVKDNDERYKNILRDILSYNIHTIKILRSIEDTKVSLINTQYGTFILKFFAPKEKKAERFLKSFVKGDYYKNLIVQTDRVRNKGNNFPNDFYLLAERKIFNYSSLFIMLIEYIEGIELNDMNTISNEIRQEIKLSMERLHSDKMLSGDPHKGNFIASSTGIRIIDLSGKGCNAQRMAKDRIAMERHLGIRNEKKDFGYYMVIYKTKLRHLLNKIKGKA